mgnify:CR=1 FL=1
MALLGLVKINFNSSLVKSFSLAITGSLPSNSGIIPNLRIFSISNSFYTLKIISANLNIPLNTPFIIGDIIVPAIPVIHNTTNII